jgi:hypothetical protein
MTLDLPIIISLEISNSKKDKIRLQMCKCTYILIYYFNAQFSSYSLYLLLKQQVAGLPNRRIIFRVDCGKEPFGVYFARLFLLLLLLLLLLCGDGWSPKEYILAPYLGGLETCSLLKAHVVIRGGAS